MELITHDVIIAQKGKRGMPFCPYLEVSLRRVLWLKKGTVLPSFPIWYRHLWPAHF